MLWSWTANFETRYSFIGQTYGFCKNSFREIEFCYWFMKYIAREIYTLYGIMFILILCLLTYMCNIISMTPCIYCIASNFWSTIFLWILSLDIQSQKYFSQNFRSVHSSAMGVSLPCITTKLLSQTLIFVWFSMFWQNFWTANFWSCTVSHTGIVYLTSLPLYTWHCWACIASKMVM